MVNAYDVAQYLAPDTLRAVVRDLEPWADMDSPNFCPVAHAALAQIRDAIESCDLFTD